MYLLIEPLILWRVHFIKLVQNSPHCFKCEVVKNLLQKNASVSDLVKQQNMRILQNQTRIMSYLEGISQKSTD